MDRYVNFTMRMSEQDFIDKFELEARNGINSIEELVELNKDTINEMPAVFTKLSAILLRASNVNKEYLMQIIASKESYRLFKEVVEKNTNYVSIKDWEDAVVNSGRMDIMFIYAYNFYNDGINIDRIINAFKKLNIANEHDSKYARLFASYILPKEEKQEILEKVKSFDEGYSK